LQQLLLEQLQSAHLLLQWRLPACAAQLEADLWLAAAIARPREIYGILTYREAGFQL